MSIDMRRLGRWLAAVCLAGTTLAGPAVAAKSVCVTVEGDSAKWVASTARRSAESVFRKLGYEVVPDGSPADAVCTVIVHKAYSHHAANPLFPIAGGIIDLWNLDAAHATVETVVRHGDQEVSRHTARATKRDIPFFGWLQPARRRRTGALSAAVRESLKQYAEGQARAETPRDPAPVAAR